MGIAFGDKLSFHFFGEPSAEYTGVVIEGIPAGTVIDTNALRAEVGRAARYESYVFPDRMPDTVVCRIISGYAAGRTTGAPVTILIKNERRAQLGEDAVLRPSMGDFGAAMKYGDAAELAGGGYSRSALLRAMTVAGGVTKQLLGESGMYIGSHFRSLGTVEDTPFLHSALGVDAAMELASRPLPFINEEMLPYAKRHIREHSESGNTVGGVIELFAIGLPAGLGEAVAHSVQSVISAELFSLPHIVGVEFGEGFALAARTGRKANDLLTAAGGRLRPDSNNYGGLDGPYTNGLPLVVRAAIAPSPMLSALQDTVNLTRMAGDVVRAPVTEITPFQLSAACEGALASALYELRFEG